MIIAKPSFGFWQQRRDETLLQSFNFNSKLSACTNISLQDIVISTVVIYNVYAFGVKTTVFVHQTV